jgi:hypothetical protein
MSRLTKNELMEQLKNQENDLRRLRRSLAMTQLDLEPAEYISSPVFETKVSEHAREVIQRGCAEWDSNASTHISRVWMVLDGRGKRIIQRTVNLLGVVPLLLFVIRGSMPRSDKRFSPLVIVYGIRGEERVAKYLS